MIRQVLLLSSQLVAGVILGLQEPLADPYPPQFPFQDQALGLTQHVKGKFDAGRTAVDGQDVA